MWYDWVSICWFEKTGIAAIFHKSYLGLRRPVPQRQNDRSGRFTVSSRLWLYPRHQQSSPPVLAWAFEAVESKENGERVKE